MYYSASRLCMCNDRSPRNGRPAPQAEQPRLVPKVTLRILCHFANVLSVVLHKSFLPIAGDRAGGRGEFRLPVHQQVPADLGLLWIQLDDRSLEHAVAVDAAWVDR